MSRISSLALLPLLAMPLAAQTLLTGSVYDGNGGPLLANTVYHLTGHVNVPSGQTLTVQAGAIVKAFALQLSVDGTLRCLGTLAQPVVFTSLHDDSAGGDTNGNGNATAAAPGHWFGLRFTATSGASTLSFTTVRYGGWGAYPNVDILSAAPSLTDCAITDGNYGGIRLDANARPNVLRTAFARCNNYPAVFGGTFRAVQDFRNNTVANCSGGNFMRVDQTTVDTDVSIASNNCLGGALVYSGHVGIAAGSTLTLGAGVVMKPTGGLQFLVDGTLRANGTAGAPVVFTDLRDDSSGGDTNGDGNASAPAPGFWFGLRFTDLADGSTLAFTAVRFAGWGAYPGVDLLSADITMSDCSITDGNYGGIRLNAAAMPSVTRCALARISNYPAVFGSSFLAVPGFVSNTVSNCSGGNFHRVDSTAIGSDVTINANNCLGGTLVYTGHVAVAAATTTTFGPGVILKPTGGLQFAVDGTLVANGTTADPVVFTSWQDDTVGGDTNGDGAATVGSPGQWFGLQLRDGADASSLTHTRLRYAGWGAYPLVDLAAADASFVECSFEHGNYGGMRLSNARPTVRRCAFDDIRNYPAIFGGDFGAPAGFEDNTVANSPGTGFHRVDVTTVSGAVAIAAQNCLGGALVYSGHVSVPVGTALRLNPGVVLKPTGGLTIDVHGRIDVAGPVVFTEFRDDSYGGDTNGDGLASTPAPGRWFGITLQPTATGVLDTALVRYTGWGARPAIDSRSSLVALRRSRAEFGSYGGFAISEAAAATDLTAFANTGIGINLLSGSYDVVRCTSAYNSTHGFARAAAWSNSVRSSLAFGNGGNGFQAFASGSINYSNGSGVSGGVGNLDVDPVFAEAVTGDLRLQGSSPCIDVGDPTDLSTERDPLGFPRRLDGNLDGAMRVDMGSHEFDNVLLLVAGAAHPGSTVQIANAALPRIRVAVLALGLPALTPLPLLNFGGVFVDLSGPFDTIVWPTNAIVPMTIPAGIPTPLTLAFQLIGLADPFPRGNTSNPAILTIR